MTVETGIRSRETGHDIRQVTTIGKLSQKVTDVLSAFRRKISVFFERSKNETQAFSCKRDWMVVEKGGWNREIDSLADVIFTMKRIKHSFMKTFEFNGVKITFSVDEDAGETLDETRENVKCKIFKTLKEAGVLSENHTVE